MNKLYPITWQLSAAFSYQQTSTNSVVHVFIIGPGNAGNFEFLPRAHMRSKGLCDRSWHLYIVYKSALFFEPIFYLPKYSLSEVYFNTDRLLIEFKGLWYNLAARQVFVAIANLIVCRLGKGLTTNIAQAPNHTPTIADTVPYQNG